MEMKRAAPCELYLVHSKDFIQGTYVLVTEEDVKFVIPMKKPDETEFYSCALVSLVSKCKDKLLPDNQFSAIYKIILLSGVISLIWLYFLKSSLLAIYISTLVISITLLWDKINYCELTFTIPYTHTYNNDQFIPERTFTITVPPQHCRRLRYDIMYLAEINNVQVIPPLLETQKKWACKIIPQ